MIYELVVEKKPGYVHAIGNGDLNEENARRFLVEAYRAAIDGQSDSLLLEFRFSGPSLTLGTVYSIIVERSPDGAMLKRIAYVDTTHDRTPDPPEFAEQVASGLGVNVRLFHSVAEAQTWLLAA